MTLEACTTTTLGPSLPGPLLTQTHQGPNILWGSLGWYPLPSPPSPTYTMGSDTHLGLQAALGREFQVWKLERS